jgi:actin cytoskeleton-regulatory complex protein SLA1
MGFLSICTALYDYQPQADGELEIKEGELLYILEKDSGDDWWKAKKRAAAEEDDEPVGLIPNNYVELVSVQALLRSSFCTSGIPASATISFQAQISQWT